MYLCRTKTKQLCHGKTILLPLLYPLCLSGLCQREQKAYTQKKIEVCWSELNAKDEAAIINLIDKNWETINEMIDKVFAGETVDIIRIRK